MAVISVSEAQATIRRFVRDTGAEEIPLTEASGRVLAREISASFPQPRFDNTAMDGFAVRAADTSEANKDLPARLALKGGIPAGGMADFEIGEGECCQIMTGAPMPHGADAVVKVEDSSGFGETGAVEILSEVRTGENVRYRGEEIAEGETLLEAGTYLGAGEIGVAATFGYGEIDVYRRPRVSIFATGDELVEPGTELGDGQIYNSNLHVFAELSEQVRAEVSVRKVLKDNRESLKAFLKDALGGSDLIVSSGGVSMGKHDYVRDVFLELGVAEHFWRVAQKPGRPFFFGTAGDTLIFGLPGNPVSSFICFMEYVWPACELMMGMEPSKKVTATLDSPFPREGAKHRFLLGHVKIEDGALRATPSGKLGSHMFTSAVGANAILDSAPGPEPLSTGQQITGRLLPWTSVGKAP